MFSYPKLKLMVYVAETVLGIVLLGISWYSFQQSVYSVNPFVIIVPAIILLAVGCLCILFGVETYFLKDDPDIWR